MQESALWASIHAAPKMATVLLYPLPRSVSPGRKGSREADQTEMVQGRDSSGVDFYRNGKGQDEDKENASERQGVKIELEPQDIEAISEKAAEILTARPSRGRGAEDAVLDKQGLAGYLHVGVSWIDKRITNRAVPFFKAGNITMRRGRAKAHVSAKAAGQKDMVVSAKALEAVLPHLQDVVKRLAAGEASIDRELWGATNEALRAIPAHNLTDSKGGCMKNSVQERDARQRERAAVETGKTETAPAAPPPSFTEDHVSEDGASGTNGTTDQEGGNTMKHLYMVGSKVNGVGYYGGLYDGADCYWDCVRDDPIVPPEEGIRDYHKLEEHNRIAALEHLNELFSEEEAKALQDYLSRFKNITMTEINKVDLPFDGSNAGLARYAKSFGFECCSLPAAWAENALPFKVAVFYDVESGVVRKEPRVRPTCEKEIDAGIKAEDAHNADELTP